MDTVRLLELATEAIDLGDNDLAAKALTIVLTETPDNARALWQVGRYHGRLGAYGEAAVYFTRAVELDPCLSTVVFNVGTHVITLRDVDGSTMPALVLEEFSRGMYDIQNRTFAPGDVALDIGAHIGAVSILLAKTNPQLRIIAYEPSASNYAMLIANLAANNVENVVAVREAVGGTAGTLELMWLPTQTAGASAFVSEEGRRAMDAAGWTRETMPCVTLDDIFTRHGIERCAFLKLDCEGAEWGIVRNAAALERVDAMALELHLPSSRSAEGVGVLQQEFAALLSNRRHVPHTVLSSTVWQLHA